MLVVHLGQIASAADAERLQPTCMSSQVDIRRRKTTPQHIFTASDDCTATHPSAAGHHSVSVLRIVSDTLNRKLYISSTHSTMTSNAYDTKPPLERGVRDLFKPPLEREYRDLISSDNMTRTLNSSPPAPHAAYGTSSPPAPHAPHAPYGTGASLPSHSSHGSGSSEVESLGSAPPPYRDDGSLAFPEKSSLASPAEQEEEHEGEVMRTENPCAAIGHDLSVSKCQRRARVATFIMCPEVAAWLMLKKRPCKRCGEKVRPKDTIFHQ